MESKGEESTLTQSRTEFGVVSNDRKIENMIQLLHLRNLFSKALVKMPRDYLARMIFDRRHLTFTMYRDNGTIVGGLCFRPFVHRGFAEVVFLAIAQGEQVRGKGTRLMNHFKEYCKRELGIKYLLTYADNFAIGYFKKQGFTADITLPTNQWKGYIKDYDGGTMMGCRIYQHIDYRDIPGSMKEIIKETCNALSHPLVDIKVYPGISSFPLQPNEIPGLEGNTKIFNPADDGWSYKTGSLEGQIASLIALAMKESNSAAFREPVSESLVPGYSSVIKNPVDLSTMAERNQRGAYTTRESFRADMRLMLDNCIQFNGHRHEITKQGAELFSWMTPKIDRLVEYVAFGENSEIRKRFKI
jgi:histone acetyltransferase